LAPHSPGTDQIDTLLTIGFVAGAIAMVAVNAGLLYALRRSRANRDREPGEAPSGRRLQFRVGALLTAFAAAVLIASLVLTEKAREVPVTGAAGLQASDSGPLKIEATAQQWLWRYDYPNGAFSYYKLVVPVDTSVEVALSSTDVIHTWNVPDLAGKRDAVPGKTHRVVFSAEEEGNYSGRAATLSGSAYASMGTEVEVVSPERYEAFVKRQKADIQTAQDEVVDQIASEDVP
jgi:cytochrome c oxidase subunit 2